MLIKWNGPFWEPPAVVPTGLSKLTPYSSPLLWYSHVSPNYFHTPLLLWYPQVSHAASCMKYTPHTQGFCATRTLAPHCSLIQSALALVGQSRLSDNFACFCKQFSKLLCCYRATGCLLTAFIPFGLLNLKLHGLNCLCSTLNTLNGCG